MTDGLCYKPAVVSVAHDTLEGLHLPSRLGALRDPPRGAGGSCWGKACLGCSACFVATMNQPHINGKKWMDKWMNIKLS